MVGAAGAVTMAKAELENCCVSELIWFSGVARGRNQDAMAPNKLPCWGRVESAPAGISTRPIALAKPAKASLPGSTANLTTAARAAARLTPSKRLLALA